MLVADAQRELRSVFLGSYVGELVSAALWAISAALGMLVSPRAAIVAMVVGGPLIFPVTSALLKITRGRGSLSPDNPFNALAKQIAFTIPFNFPVVAGATLYKLNWFFPAMLVVVGTHYLPFVFLYGMRAFYGAAVVMVAAGMMIALNASDSFTLGGWVGAAILVAFSFVVKAAGRD